MEKIRFGCYIYQEGLEYEDIKRIVIECERLGFDSVWLKDNFIPWLQAYFSGGYVNEKETMLECWTTLSSLAAITKRIRLGAILVNLYRNPSILAKMVSTLDVISNGRLEFGLSAGWYEREFKAYGIIFPKGSVRVRMLQESITIIKKMLTERQVSFKGKYYNIAKAVCNPKPIQKPCPPIWIGGAGKKTLELAAKHADAWNYGLCTYDKYLNKLSFLKDYCRIIDRKYEGMVKGWQGAMLLGKDEEELRSRMNMLVKGVWKTSGLVIAGTPEKILKEIERYVTIGVNYFTIYYPDLPDLRSLQLFAEHIIPHFRN
ncbi:MAG: LLM class flavin-dependent oxidoreductase [Thermodesulfobacteriota bacterium]